MPSLPNTTVNEGEGQKSRLQTKVCDKCGSRFSGESRFCPFDAEPLTVAVESLRPKDPLLRLVIDGRYEILSVLGEGGMGTVYRVSHRVLGRALALKVLRADLSREEELGLRFLREARAAASISHPNVVQITDFGTLPSGQPYFVMELLTGESLSRVLRSRGPLPSSRVVRLVRQMVDALSAAHTAGVIHRDLKPDNILICPTPSGAEAVKVLDFGLAKVAGNSRLTKAGVVFGTPHYMSPEQASGRVVDERTDVYALGVLMYEMFTGKVPFEADTYMGVLTKHLYVAPTPPSVALGTTHGLGALEQVTLRCLEKKPERRFASMRALGEAIDEVARFDEKGALVVSPAVLGDPGEDPDDDAGMPSSIYGREGRLSRGRPEAERRLGTLMVFALAFVGLFALALIGLLSRNAAPPGGPAARDEPRPVSVGSGLGAPPERAALAAQNRTPALESGEPKPVTTPRSLPPPKASAPLPTPGAAGVANLPSSRTSREATPAGSESPPAVAPAPVAPKSPIKHQKLNTGEIVDPWGG